MSTLLRDIAKTDRICPLRALAYTITGVPNRVEEPVCIRDRCAWYVQSSECCAVKMLML